MKAGVFLLPLACGSSLERCHHVSKPNCSRSDTLPETRVSLLFPKSPALRILPTFATKSDALRRRIVGWTRADVKSEPYEVSDSVPESVRFRETQLSLVEDGELGQRALPWWKQFPKRWLIVVLCFSAFLLCNMDRVNMSIAILPMSAEFNWNPATVGLIQSSFFWGYLLTQAVHHIVLQSE